MAQITIDIADGIAADVRDSLHAYWGGDVAATNVQKNAYVKQHLAGYIKSQYKAAKAVTAVRAAEDASNATTSNADIS